MKFRSLVVPVLLAMLISIVSFSAIIFYAANKQDTHALETEKSALTYALELMHKTPLSLSNDTAVCDVAVKNIYLTQNLPWIDQTIGGSIDRFDYLDGIIILGADGALVYQKNNNPSLDMTGVDSIFSSLMDGMNIYGTEDAKDRSGFVRTNDRIVAFSMSMLRLRSRGYNVELPNKMPVVVFFTVLDNERIHAMEDHNGVQNLKVNLGEPSKAALQTIKGILPIHDYYGMPIAYYTWRTEEPGTMMIRTIIVPAILSLLLVVVALAYFVRQVVHIMKELEIANRSKSSFLASMSHEIRTPLNSIIGFSEMVSLEIFGKIEGKKNKEYLGLVKSSSEHLLSIINDILDLSKLEAGKFIVYAEEISPRDVVRTCMDLVKATASDKNISMHFNCTPGFLRSDERIMRQILLNILSNALKFTPLGGKIDVEGMSKKDAYEIRITDSGIGMTEEQISLALSPFGQVESELKRTHQGTGLGLPLVERFIQLLNGQMKIKSELSKGTTVTLYFPNISREKYL